MIFLGLLVMTFQTNSEFILQTQNMIKNQLGWFCSECGSLEYLQVHHITKPLVQMKNRGRGQKRRALEWRKSLRVNNLKVLCTDCHVEYHRGN